MSHVAPPLSGWAGRAIPPHDQLYIAGIDDQLFQGATVNEPQDLSDIVVIQTHLRSLNDVSLIDSNGELFSCGLQQRDVLQALLQRHAGEWRGNGERRDRPSVGG